MSQETILVVDDDREIVGAIAAALEKEGWRVLRAYDGMEALDKAVDPDLRLILMDVMMPKLDGLSAVLRIRERRNLPIIVLSAKSEESDKVLGLSMGADDYVTKPFNPLELVARVKTQLRRYTRYNQRIPALAEPEEYDIRGLQISRAAHRCALFGEELSLTPLEFSILWHLCRRQGRVVPSEELFEAVWGEKYLDGNNTVMSHIARLREKLHEPRGQPRFIKTVWGVGYTIE